MFTPPVTGKSGFTLSCCSIALRDKPVFEAVQEIANAGFSSVEVWHPHISKLDGSALRELARRCSELDLGIPVIAPYFSFTQGPEAVRESLKTAEHALNAARILGAKNIRTFIDVGRDGLPSCKAGESHWRGALEGLAQLCRLDPSVNFVVETHENTLADTLPSVRRIFENIHAANLRLNFQANRDFLSRGYMGCLRELYPLIAHLHLQQVRKDGSETYVEESGEIDFQELITFLGAWGYAGNASVEYCWPGVERGRLATAHAFFDRLLAPLPSDA